MKVVAYSIKPFEKEFLAKANQKKHDITLISNALSADTVGYAEGKDAVIVFTSDDVSAVVIEKLAGLGIKYIVTRSRGTDHIDKEAALKYGIKIANIPTYSPQAIAEHVVALAFSLNRQIIKPDKLSHQFNFTNDELIGFNFSGKMVGLIGLGSTGEATAKIFNGLGCNVIGYDLNNHNNISYISPVTLDVLFETSDIISLHVPLTTITKHLIRRETIHRMKPGVMLINTSNGALINTKDVVAALDSGKIGYLGLDIYEYDKDLFFENPEVEGFKDSLIKKLLQHPNVVITSHQAYLTREALLEIANETIKNLDTWQSGKCVGDACSCAKDCKLNDKIKPEKENVR